MLYVDCFCSLNFISEVAEKKARWMVNVAHNLLLHSLVMVLVCFFI
ncbi:unnamed protein product [Prunus brigantina]